MISSCMVYLIPRQIFPTHLSGAILNFLYEEKKLRERYTVWDKIVETKQQDRSISKQEKSAHAWGKKEDKNLKLIRVFSYWNLIFQSLRYKYCDPYLINNPWKRFMHSYNMGYKRIIRCATLSQGAGGIPFKDFEQTVSVVGLIRITRNVWWFEPTNKAVSRQMKNDVSWSPGAQRYT